MGLEVIFAYSPCIFIFNCLSHAFLCILIAKYAYKSLSKYSISQTCNLGQLVLIVFGWPVLEFILGQIRLKLSQSWLFWNSGLGLDQQEPNPIGPASQQKKRPLPSDGENQAKDVPPLQSKRSVFFFLVNNLSNQLKDKYMLLENRGKKSCF